MLFSNRCFKGICLIAAFIFVFAFFNGEVLTIGQTIAAAEELSIDEAVQNGEEEESPVSPEPEPEGETPAAQASAAESDSQEIVEEPEQQISAGYESELFGEALVAEINESQPEEAGELQGSEIPELREENTKFYELEDGTIEAVTFLHPVHYEEDGEWKDIDNTLTLNTKARSANGTIKSSGENSFDAEFSTQTSSGDIVRIQDGKYALSWTLAGISQGKQAEFRSKLEKTQWDSIQSDAVKRQVLPGKESNLIYKDAMEHVDLRYDLIYNQVKESIILKNSQAPKTFTQRITVANLALRIANGEIDAYDPDTDEVIFSIPAPFMEDASGRISYDITPSLEETAAGYDLTYTLDEEWLAAAQYPVVVDPYVSKNTSASGCLDNRICAAYPDTNYKSSYIMCTGYGSSSHTNYSLVKFPMPTIPSASILHSAEFKATMVYQNATNTATVGVHKVTKSWNENVTWNTRPTYNSTAVDSVSVATTQNKTYTWDITSLANDWRTTNYGLLMKNENNTSGYREWGTSASTVTPPTLIIRYRVTAPTVTFTPTGWTNASSIQINWSGIQPASEIQDVRYCFDWYDGITWTFIPNTAGKGSGSVTASITGLSNDIHLELRF